MKPTFQAPFLSPQRHVHGCPCLLFNKNPEFHFTFIYIDNSPKLNSLSPTEEKRFTDWRSTINKNAINIEYAQNHHFSNHGQAMKKALFF